MASMLVMEKPNAYKADSVDQDGLWKKVIGCDEGTGPAPLCLQKEIDA
ncbi:hypothetical protein OXB_2639 [Bacillus sp. OxB-1]|nr:hypothetical protein [Bacillus sp. OxB-1]BAQ11110.1 hypothetical protein OXB_2639 [Bacillus sp. OxB-1]